MPKETVTKGVFRIKLRCIIILIPKLLKACYEFSVIANAKSN